MEDRTHFRMDDMDTTRNTYRMVIRAGIDELAQMVENNHSRLMQKDRTWLIRYKVFRCQWIFRDRLRYYSELYLLLPLERFWQEGRSKSHARLCRLSALMVKRHHGFQWLRALERAIEENGIRIETKYFDGGMSTSFENRILVRPFMTVRARFHYLIVEYVRVKLGLQTPLQRCSTIAEARTQAIAYAIARTVGLESRYHSQFYTIGRCCDHETIRRDRRLTIEIGSELLRQMIRQARA